MLAAKMGAPVHVCLLLRNVNERSIVTCDRDESVERLGPGRCGE
jgi:hypothetical protein